MESNLTMPLWKSPVGIWVNAAHKDQGADLLQNPSAIIAIKEGDISDELAQAYFPNHRKIWVPQLANADEALQLVQNGQADFTFAEPIFIQTFNGNLVQITDPIRISDNVLMVGKGENRLTEFLNDQIAELGSDGIIHKLVEKDARQYIKGHHGLILS